jgi:type IV secretory pathway TraG/TraD family ATPase VirD4
MEAIDQGLTLLRSQGLRLAFFFQSLGQLTKVFKGREAVLLDNCETIWFGTQSLESAQRVSQMCGEQTILVEGAGESHSTQEQSQQPGTQRGSSWSRDYKVQARALLKPEEVLSLPGNQMVCFLKNLPPLLCRRIACYSDPYFRRWGGPPVAWWIVLAATIGLAAWMVWGR